MIKILVIGGGFSGIACIRRLSNYQKRFSLNVTLIDQKPTSDFLPLLPDVLGRKINPKYLAYDIRQESRKLGIKYLMEEINSIDLAGRKVLTKFQSLDYDYLIIASGSETNFYGNDNIKRYAFKLDSAEDSERIFEALEKNDFDNYLVAGGGYTGVEVVTNLRVHLRRKSKDKKVIIIERAPAILGPLPQWMKEYVANNLKTLDIEVLLNTIIEKTENNRVYLTNGRVFNNSILIWAAGVKTASFIQDLKTEKNPQGRIKVDEYLRLNEHCFVIGDAGFFPDKDGFLRMAVQFAISEGEHAASNLIRSIRGVNLCKYRPRDFGYIIPMANNQSCGKVLGFEIKGTLPTLLHYLMCIYRSPSFKNKLGLMKDLFKR